MATTVHGFELLEEREIPELNTMAKLYRHVETGAELLSLENDDENKVFGITFRTPPEDSTGLPHIMEHSVLCGSRKYPVKEPFVELMKGSLNTFLNALTFSDKTCYPVASQNLQDFYNLVDVYLDAVFYPRITPETFEQEAWHYELNDLSEPLTYKGVVFNEMKGAYSSPDGLVGRYSQAALFPDNTYGFDSGGDPTVIPDLTYEQFKAFHETFYHPSNARIFFYGDDDPTERLRVIQGYLKDFEARPVASAIPLHPNFDSPRRMTRPYPVSEDAEQQKAFVTVNWLLPENNDPALNLALQILSYALVGIPASPLRKALIDSGLGEDVIGHGLDDDLRQLFFMTGMKGVAPENVDKIEQLVLDTLEDLVENGIDPDMVEAAMNTIEFRLREQNFGSYPRGLIQMFQALTTWLHDGDPMAALAFESPLAMVKTQAAQDPHYLEGLIQTHLIQNPHRVLFVLEPDIDLQQQQQAAESARLSEARTAMSEDELRVKMENTRRLKKLQETPDSSEALATIPRLTLEDLDKNSKSVPTLVTTLHDTKVIFHDLFTNGIVYLDVGFDLHVLPQELLPYVMMFSAALLEIGTESEDFVKLTQRIGRETGGIRSTTFHSMVAGTDQATSWLFLRGKATMAQVDELLVILRDILLTVKLDNKERFKQMLLERKAREEAQLVPSGHRTILYRLRSKLSESDWANEQLLGVSHLFFVRKLIEQVENDWPAVLEKLEDVRRILVNRNAMLCNVTLDAANWETVKPKLGDFIATLAAPSISQVSWSPPYNQAAEALTIPAQVNYVAKGASLYDLGYACHGSINVIVNYVRATWLWEKIRVQGGAYGGFCVFDQHSGTFSYVSYRDPNVLSSLVNYGQTSDFLKGLELSDDELVKSIIGAIGTIDAYQLPDAKGYSALLRHLVNYTDDARQKFRDEVLSTTVEDFRDFGEVLARLNEAGCVAVLGSREAILAADDEGKIGFSLTKVL